MAKWQLVSCKAVSEILESLMRWQVLSSALRIGVKLTAMHEEVAADCFKTANEFW